MSGRFEKIAEKFCEAGYGGVGSDNKIIEELK
jgi:hypothetical protein